jgi:hypothetical protein
VTRLPQSSFSVSTIFSAIGTRDTMSRQQCSIAAQRLASSGRLPIKPVEYPGSLEHPVCASDRTPAEQCEEMNVGLYLLKLRLPLFYEILLHGQGVWCQIE